MADQKNDSPVEDTLSATIDKTIIGKAYQLALMDSLWELLYAVASDVTAHPGLYNEGCPTNIVEMSYAIGTSEMWLNQPQRMAIYGPLVGKSGGSADLNRFESGRQKVLSAAVMLTATVYEGGEEAIKATLGTVAGNFNRNNIQPYLTRGSQAFVGLLDVSFTQVATTLKDAGVRLRFGVGEIDDEWPNVIDSNGTKLVEAIATQLKPGTTGSFNASRFADMQHVANTGKAALVTLADATGTYNDDILSKSIAWHGALQDMRSTA